MQIAGQVFFSLTEFKKQDQNRIISDFFFCQLIYSFKIYNFKLFKFNFVLQYLIDLIIMVVSHLSLVCNFTTSSLFNFRRKRKAAAKEAIAKGDATEVISNS